MEVKTIIILANSRKRPSGRCIAGKVLSNGQTREWIRPVSERPTHEVSERERGYQHGGTAQLLDIVAVPLIEASSTGHQTENFVLDKGYYWEKKGVADWAAVVATIDPYDASFWGNSQNTYHGLRDKVAEADVAAVHNSLKMIQVTNLVVKVQSEPGFEGNAARRRVRAAFTYHNVQYLLSVTHPDVEDGYLNRPNGDYPVPNAVLCISLVEVWNGFAFRVIATLLTPDMCQV